MSCDIAAFSIFKTFPLITCFVGLGLGLALGNDKHFKLFPIALLILTCIVKVPDLLGFWNVVVFPTESGFTDWGQKHTPASAVWIYMIFFGPFIIFTLSGPFAVMVTIGSRLGALFSGMKALRAYSINLAGAIVGSIAFSVLAFQDFAPWQLLVLPCLCVLPYCIRYDQNKIGTVAAFAVALGVASWTMVGDGGSTLFYPPNAKIDVEPPETHTIWSPYQRLDVVPIRFVTVEKDKKIVVPLGVNVFANRQVYQCAQNLSDEAINKDKLPVLTACMTEWRHRYILPMRLKRPLGEVLVIGAGSGTDVMEALNDGAEHVDAVDIDPGILKIGKLFNPGKPYDNPRVTVHCDDARHYINHCKKKYDLIVYSHLDSIAAIGQGASVRVDNYVYAKESFSSSLLLLKPDGLMVVSFCTKKDWFRDRLFRTLEEAAGYAPIVVGDRRTQWTVPNTFFILGAAARDNKLSLPEAQNDVYKIIPDYKPEQGTKVLSDDWPFLYAYPGTFDWPYLFVVAEIVLLSVYAGRKVLFGPSSAADWQLFFMGAAFLLLELQSISRLSLIFGASWLTTAIVINSILVAILLSNLSVMFTKYRAAKLRDCLYILLALSLTASYFFPFQMFIGANAAAQPLGPVLVTAITCLPMFFAGIIFSLSFERVENTRRALAFNLLGSIVGALLEYLSNYFGIRSLIIVSGVLYLCSWLCMHKHQLPEAKSESP